MIDERALPENYRPALAEDVPEGRACGNCVFYNEDRQNDEGTKAWCEKWDDFVDGGYYCNAWQPYEEDDESGKHYDEEETRAVDLSAPEYMVSAAKRGLRLYADGEAGAGLVDATVRDARSMAQGTISEAKWRKIGPWIARHIDDLDAVDAETPITPGLVAHLLWGSGPSKQDALRAQQYAEGVVERLNSEQDRSVNKTFHISRREEIENMRENNEQTTEVETRRVTVQEFELREGLEGSMSFRVYAAVYNSPSEPLPFTETIAPGAFDKTLRARNNVKMYLNPDSTLVLASTRAKTMKLTSDSKGLLVESDLPDTSPRKQKKY